MEYHKAFDGITLVLGGARSGKSRFGEQLALAAATSPIYLATAEIRDEEMRARIDRHRETRGKNWTTLEEPVDIAAQIDRFSAPEYPILVDCLTLWLSNLMERDLSVGVETERLCGALEQAQGRVVLVANEVGLGIVPENDLARQFRDEAGRLNQTVAALADHVVYMVAGLPLPVKKNGKALITELMT